MSKKTGIFILSSWVSLGFYRGTKYYGNDYKKHCIRYEERKDKEIYRQRRAQTLKDEE